MEQLASIPRKFLALLSMVDPCPDITLTARFSSFQYTARLKLLGLTRYDVKSGLAPLENSGGTCTNDSLECCAKDRSIHSHSSCTSGNGACFHGTQKIEDMQSAPRAPGKEPNELYSPAEDGRGIPEPSVYATLGISSKLVRSNSHLDHGLASAVVTVSNEDPRAQLPTANLLPSKLILATGSGYAVEVYEGTVFSPLHL
jgi:hypothetical protein